MPLPVAGQPTLTPEDQIVHIVPGPLGPVWGQKGFMFPVHSPTSYSSVQWAELPKLQSSLCCAERNMCMSRYTKEKFPSANFSLDRGKIM